MRTCLLTCAALFATFPAFADNASVEIDLIHGHQIYHESSNEAGVTMALSIAHEHGNTASLVDLCDELRVTAGLENENEDGLGLATIFIVPYKGMAVEGYYLPDDGTFEKSALVSGNLTARAALDAIMVRAGIPPYILDETDIEHEISCDPDEPLWTVAWQDVRDIGDEEPEVVIERARDRFLAVYQSVVERALKQETD